jgi:hypothetical protein
MLHQATGTFLKWSELWTSPRVRRVCKQLSGIRKKDEIIMIFKERALGSVGTLDFSVGRRVYQNFKLLERETGLEPATFSLARRRSSSELLSRSCTQQARASLLPLALTNKKDYTITESSDYQLLEPPPPPPPPECPPENPLENPEELLVDVTVVAFVLIPLLSALLIRL